MAVSLIVKLIGNTTQFASSFNAAKKTMTSGVARMKSDWGKISPAITKVTLATVGLGVASIKMASDYQKGIAEITTLMGEVAPAAVKKMSNEIKDLAMASGQALDKLTKARYDIVSAGFSDAADSAKLLEQATRTATAGVTDVSVAADILTTSINAYGKTVDDAAQISDTLFTTVRLGKTTMTELAGSLGHAIPIAAQAGVSLEELSASIAVLTARGQNTAEAVTAIRASVVELLKPSENLQKIYDALGIASGQALISQYGFAGSLKEIEKKAKELGIPLQDVFANIRSMQAALPLASDASDDLTKAMDEMKTAAGATDIAYKKMASTFDFLKSQVMQSFKVIMIDIGETILPDVQKAFENLRDNMPEIREKIMGVAEGFKKVIEWTVEHGDLIKIIIGVGVAFKTASLGVVLFKLAINPVGASIAIVTGALLGLTAALKKQKEVTDGIEVIESWADSYLEMADGAETLAEKESALRIIEGLLANLRSSIKSGEITGADYIAESINVEVLTAAITKLKNEIISLQSVSKPQAPGQTPDTPSGKQTMPTNLSDWVDTSKSAIGEIDTITESHTLSQIEAYGYEAQMWAEANESKVANWAEAANQIMSISNSLASYQINEAQRTTNSQINKANLSASSQINAIQNKVKNGTLTEQQGADKIAIINADLQDTLTKIQEDGAKKGREIRRAQKPYMIAEGIAGTAAAVIGALGNKPWGPWNFILAGLVGAAGAAQVATIATQKFATGGDFVTSGPQTIMVGDNPGGRERVQITPQSSPNINGPSNSEVNHNYYVSIYANDSKSFEDFLNGAGRQPTIEFIEKVSYRREL